MLEILFSLLIPYPGLEYVLDGHDASVLVFLSAAVIVRTVFWRHFLYYPYPIRQKGKVTCFTGNLGTSLSLCPRSLSCLSSFPTAFALCALVVVEFTYHEFVLKKVFDESPLKKLLMIYSVLVVVVAYVLRSIESVNATCTWKTGAAGDRAEDLECSAFGWDKALWLIVTTFASTVYVVALTSWTREPLATIKHS